MTGLDICPHGDETCPCPDVYDGVHDACHYERYEGVEPMPCPTTGIVGCRECRL